VGEELVDRGGLGEGLVDVAEEVGVEGGEARGEAVPGGVDVGVSGLDDMGQEVGDFGLLGFAHLVLAQSGVLVEGAAMVEVEEDLAPFTIVALVGLVDGDHDVDFAVGGADLGDLGVDAEVAEHWVMKPMSRALADGVWVRSWIWLRTRGRTRRSSMAIDPGGCGFFFIVSGLGADLGGNFGWIFGKFPYN
jgi:hypothetical protein